MAFRVCLGFVGFRAHVFWSDGLGRSHLGGSDGLGFRAHLGGRIEGKYEAR